MTYEQYSALVVDNSDRICYISDPENYDVLYLNKAMQDLIHVSGEPEYLGHKCYKLLQGLDRPCPFCTNKYLKPGVRYCWEHYNEMLGRHYALEDTLLAIEGRKLRLELCTDVTEHIMETSRLAKKLSTEETLVRCIHTLSSGEDASSAINNLLEIIGEFYCSGRAYIFEFDSENGILNNTYEWCREGVSAEIENLQCIPLEAVSAWIERFNKSGDFFITSLEGDLSPDSLDYKILKPQGIQSLMAASLVWNDEIVGFIGVDDPTENTNDTGLLRSVTFFVMNDLEKRRMFSQLEVLSYTDALTGMQNRLKYMENLQCLAEDPPESLGFVFADINGLKTANDTKGHAYGDHLLIIASGLMAKFFDNCVYRIGGDEFVAVVPNISKEEFNDKVSALRQLSADDCECKLSVGSGWKSGVMDVFDQAARADEIMYREKQLYYKTLLGMRSSHLSADGPCLLEEQ